MSLILKDRLKILRKEKEKQSGQKLPRWKVAKALNVKPATYGGWEAGRTEPRPEFLIPLARYYGVTVDYLLGGEDVSQTMRRSPSTGISWAQQLLPRNVEEERIMDIFQGVMNGEDSNQPRDEVERALKEVINLDLVRVIDVPRDKQLGERVVKAFGEYGLRDAIIVRYENDPGSALKTEVVGHAASKYFKEVVRNGDKVGFAGGSAISSLIHNLLRSTEIDNFPVIEMYPIAIHPVSDRADVCANTLVGILAHRYSSRGVKGYALQASGFYVGKTEKYVRSEITTNMMNAILGINKAFIGIGSRELTFTLLRDVINALGSNIVERLKTEKCVGDLLYHPINSQGEVLCEDEIGSRICSTPLQHLKRMVSIGYSVIAVVGGSDQAKVDPVHGAIRGGFINVLIATTSLAEKLLDPSA